MDEKLGSRQFEILNLLLNNKSGLSIDQCALELDISRNAAHKHLTILEGAGYIRKSGLKRTAGRPVCTYVLTEAGINRMPKQYAWIAQLIIDNLDVRLGPFALQGFMNELGLSLAQQHLPRFTGMPLDERIKAVLQFMNDLGYYARVQNELSGSHPAILVKNCIFHDLAQKHQEICEFDKAYLSLLLERKVDLLDCMAKGREACCFKIEPE